MNDSLPASAASDPDALAARLIQSSHLGDGLPELVSGVVYLFFCGMCWSSHFAQHGSADAKTAARTAASIFLFLAAFAGLALVPLVRWARAEYLTARSGYVKHKPRRRRVSAIVSTAVVAGTVVTLVALGFNGVLSQRSMLISTGALLGGLWMLLGRHLRFVVNGLLIALSAVLTAFSVLSIEIAWATFYAFAGVLMLASGAAVLLRFLRRTSEQPE